MTEHQISYILAQQAFPELDPHPSCIETHISWIILTREHAYKIKKPIQLDFLDFSTLEARKACCIKEVVLNKRLAPHMYIDTVPIKMVKDHVHIGDQREFFTPEEAQRLLLTNLHMTTKGQVIDFAVKMKRMDNHLKMDQMLSRGSVTPLHLKKLAEVIANFHKEATINAPVGWIAQMKDTFNGIGLMAEEVGQQLGDSFQQLITLAIATSDHFLKKYEKLLNRRISQGFIRDIHGDFHAGNIFLTDTPTVFDCIEYNDEFRTIDVLNEIAFLCMDLEKYGKKELSDIFLQSYLSLFPSLKTPFEEKLFLYYKLFRANVRAKVEFIRVSQMDNGPEKTAEMEHMFSYFRLMNTYLDEWHDEKKNQSVSCTCKSCKCVELRQLKAEFDLVSENT